MKTFKQTKLKELDLHLMNEDNFYPCTNRECEGCFGQIREDKLRAFLSSTIDEAVEQVKKLALSDLTEDITKVEFIQNGKQQWEYKNNRGIEPCMECFNSN